MTYTVYASRAEEVKKQLDRLAKKAKTYSVPFAYMVGEEHPAKVNVFRRGMNEPVSSHMVEAVDFEIDCDQLIKANGWQIRAKIEHGENGNIVTGFHGNVLREWYSTPARCDHCGVNRYRSVTFICENESGELRQVGSSCLKDYTGISPATAAIWAAVVDIFPDSLDCMDDEWEERRGERMFGVKVILAFACDSIKEFGYVKSSELGSTRERVLEKVLRNEAPSDESLAKAELLCAWMNERGEKARRDDEELAELNRKAHRYDNDFGHVEVIDEEAHEMYLKRDRELYQAWDRVSDLERNCVPVIRSGYAKSKHIGRLVYIPVAYETYLERKERAEQKEKERADAAAASQYVGEVGKRLTITAENAKLVTSWENDYGITFLYRFVDTEGNVFIYKASRSIEISNGMKLKGTVKAHSEYNGVKQTVITRCCVA